MDESTWTATNPKSTIYGVYMSSYVQKVIAQQIVIYSFQIVVILVWIDSENSIKDLDFISGDLIGMNWPLTCKGFVFYFSPFIHNE